ncbi:protein FMC1 homolog [Acanthaster planci]|uniref:Protein FMC1 homolog n=1 Tax=Acanthaster planci TaxID=133434 RepID=A0A8B7XYY8_ACAPL|nr:protein FMC1 homolog [Acanthaster planci]
MSKIDKLRLLRSLLRELREAKMSSPRNTMAYGYLMDQFRKNQVTSEKFCKEHNEMWHQAQTYLCMLKSTREHEALQAAYKRGERTVEESAKLVGLKIPKPYEE